jgi:predicted O-methyltransferase YrrM
MRGVPRHVQWFSRRYGERFGSRTPTLVAALEAFARTGGRTIVETGCMREAGSISDGCSTAIFAEAAARCGGFLWSVDHDPAAVRLARRLTARFARHRKVVASVSVTFFSRGLAREPGFSGAIDLLYLDSADYPLPEMHESARFLFPGLCLDDVPEAEILSTFADLIDASQATCAAELEAAWPFLHGGSAVLIDDRDFPGGGKGRRARAWLARHRWTLEVAGYQELWRPPPAAGGRMARKA